MQRVEFGMVKDKLWLYYKEGESEPDTVQVVEVAHKTVTLSNGDKISTDRFYELCEPALDESPTVSEESEFMDELSDELDLDTSEFDGIKPKNDGVYDPVEEMMKGIKYDSNGIPIPTNSDKQRSALQPKHVAQSENITSKINSSPLISLAEKGQFKDVELVIKLKVPTMNKIVFNALADAYPPEEIDVLLDYIISKIGGDKIEEIIKQKILSYYKTNKKNAAQ